MCYTRNSPDQAWHRDVTTFCHSVNQEYSEYLLEHSHLQNILWYQLMIILLLSSPSPSPQFPVPIPNPSHSPIPSRFIKIIIPLLLLLGIRTWNTSIIGKYDPCDFVVSPRSLLGDFWAVGFGTRLWQMFSCRTQNIFMALTDSWLTNTCFLRVQHNIYLLSTWG